MNPCQVTQGFALRSIRERAKSLSLLACNSVQEQCIIGHTKKRIIVSAATLHPRRSEVNSGQCTPIQPDSAHFWTFTYGSLHKILPEPFLYIMDTPDSILVSVAAEMVAFQ